MRKIVFIISIFIVAVAFVFAMTAPEEIVEIKDPINNVNLNNSNITATPEHTYTMRHSNVH